MFPEDNLKHIELNTAFYVDILGLSRPQGLGGKSIILYFRVGVLNTPKHRILSHMQSYRTINDVREVKIHYVVASDNIRVNFDQEISPGLEECLLIFEAVDLRADYRRAGT